MNPPKNGTQDETVAIVGAINIGVPEKISWAVRSGDQSWSGRSIEEFIRCFGDNAMGETATLSVSLMFSLSMPKE